MGRCLLLPYPRRYLARVASAELPVNLAFTARGVPFVGPAASGPSNEKCHAFKATRLGVARDRGYDDPNIDLTPAVCYAVVCMALEEAVVVTDKGVQRRRTVWCIACLERGLHRIPVAGSDSCPVCIIGRTWRRERTTTAW